MTLAVSRIAQDIFLQSGFAGDEEPDGAGALAVGFFGAGRVTFGPPTQVPTYVIHCDPCTSAAHLYVREDLTDEALTMSLARAVARWWYERQLIVVMSESDLEDLAIMLALPERGFLSAAVRAGWDAEYVAEQFVVPAPIAKHRLRQLTRPQSGTHVRLVHAS